jgi:hypothetical protein
MSERRSRADAAKKAARYRWLMDQFVKGALDFTEPLPYGSTKTWSGQFGRVRKLIDDHIDSTIDGVQGPDSQTFPGKTP